MHNIIAVFVCKLNLYELAEKKIVYSTEINLLAQQ